MDNYENTNYIEINNLLIYRSSFIYVDCRKYFADDIFIKNKIKIKYGKELDYNNYKILFVSTNKSNDYLFIKSMCELQDMIEERGYEDYNEVCKTIFSEIIKPKKKVK